MRRALAGIVPAEVLSRKTKQFAARTLRSCLISTGVNIQAAYCSSFSSSLGYVDDTELLKVVGDVRAGKTVSLRARALDDFTGILVARLGAAWTAGIASSIRAGHSQARDTSQRLTATEQASARSQRTEYFNQGEPP